MRVLFVACYALGWAAAQLTTQTGCTCKSSSQVNWRLSGGGIGGGFSHYGCSTGPYEDRTPAQGHNWCDTQQSDCNNGQGWDLCTPSASPKTSKGINKDVPEAVNVNLGAQSQQQLNQNVNSNVNNQQSGLSLNVNVNVGGGGGSSAPITTVKGCTCHPTSEVILMQNGVRVGGGFSHTGCGTGPYEANSPGHGSPWCDTIETFCSAGWDLCVPPAGQSSTPQNSYTPPLPPPPPAQNTYATNSFTAYSNQGAYSLPLVPPPTFQPWVPPPPTPQPWIPPPPTPQPYIPAVPANPFQPFQTPAYQPAQTPAYQPAQTPAYQPAQTPSYQSPQTQQQQYSYNAQQYPSAYLVQQTKTSTPVSMPQSRSSYVPARGSANGNVRQTPRAARKGRGGGFDYDYDSSSSSSSSSSLLPLMLLSKGASGSSSSSANSLLPLMLASEGGGSSSSMLPMMMMSGGFGGSSGSSSSMLTQFAMLNAFRRSGDGEAEDSTNLGEIGQTLGFTRAVVSKDTSSLVNSTNDSGANQTSTSTQNSTSSESD